MMILLFIRLCIYVQLLVSSLSSIWSDKIYFHRLSFLGDFPQMFAIILLFSKNTFWELFAYTAFHCKRNFNPF